MGDISITASYDSGPRERANDRDGEGVLFGRSVVFMLGVNVGWDDSTDDIISFTVYFYRKLAFATLLMLLLLLLLPLLSLLLTQADFDKNYALF